MLDIFNSDAFSITSLTDALRDIRPRPTRLNDLGLFTASSVATTSISIERIGDILQIVAPTPRGGPGDTKDVPKRNIRSIPIPHFQRDWSVLAEEVQGLRAFGAQDQLVPYMSVIAQKLADNAADLDITQEYSRIGAIQGVVTYKGGSSLDLYQTFGVAQPAEVNFDLTNLGAADGTLLKKCTSIIRATRKALGAVNFSYIHCFCDDSFFDDLLTHPEVRKTYFNTNEAAFLRDSFVGPNRGSNPIFQFGGIVWENYGAIDDTGDGALLGIPTGKAKFVPMGVPGLFRTYYAPADYEETVNTLGQPNYAKQWPMENGKGRNGEIQRNNLEICTRPNALMRAKRTA